MAEYRTAKSLQTPVSPRGDKAAAPAKKHQLLKRLVITKKLKFP